MSKGKNEYSKGYAFIPGWLLFDERVSGDAKVTWAVIYKLPGKKKSEYVKRNVSLDFIANLRGFSRREIQRHMAELKEFADVSMLRRYNKPSIIILHLKKDE